MTLNELIAQAKKEGVDFDAPICIQVDYVGYAEVAGVACGYGGTYIDVNGSQANGDFVVASTYYGQ